MVYSGAWGELIHEKTRSRKSRDTVPLTSPMPKENHPSRKYVETKVKDRFTTIFIFSMCVCVSAGGAPLEKRVDVGVGTILTT